MESTVIVAAISFAGTLLGTLGGIITSSRLINYRLEQLEKKVDAQIASTVCIPVVEEKIKSIDRRILILEKGDAKYDNFKGYYSKNNNIGTGTTQSFT